MADRVQPPVQHQSLPYGRIVDDISTTPVNMRTRLPTLAAFTAIVAAVFLAVTMELPMVVVVALVVCASGLAIIVIAGAPRVFMRSGYPSR